MNVNFSSLKTKKVLGKEGKGIGTIIHVLNFPKKDSEKEYYALLRIPRALRRPIVFPLPLTTNPPIYTKKGDYILLTIEKNEFLEIVSQYSQERKRPKNRRKSNKITPQDASLALKLWSQH